MNKFLTTGLFFIRTFLLAVFLIGSISCQKELSYDLGDTGGVGGSPGGTAEIYYKATIGGVNYYQGVSVSNNYEAGSGIAGADDVIFGGGIGYIDPPAPMGLTEMGVSKGKMHHYLSATQAQFKAFFAPGEYSFASDGNGVMVDWRDPNGEYWDTRDGLTDQNGSTFKIISVQDAPDLTGTFYLKVKMQFNCKLYNVNTGVMKQLTNGEMVAFFGMF